MRRSRSRAFAAAISFRITAVAAAWRLPMAPGPPVQAIRAAAAAGPMPGTGIGMSRLPASSSAPATVSAIRRSCRRTPASISGRTFGTGPSGSGSPAPSKTALGCTRRSTSLSRSTGMSRSRPVAASAGAVGGLAGNAAPKAASTLAPALPVFAMSPAALAKSRDWRGLPARTAKPRSRGDWRSARRIPRGLHDDPLRPAVPRDAGDLAEAVRVVGGGVIPAVQADVRRLPARVNAGGCDGHVSRSCPRDDPVLEPGHPSRTREAEGRAGRPRFRPDPLARSMVLPVRPVLRGQAPLRRRHAWRRRSRHGSEPWRRRKAGGGFSTGTRAKIFHSHLPVPFRFSEHAKVWRLYRSLCRCRKRPAPLRKLAMEKRFDRIFGTAAGCASLDGLLERLKANRDELLRVPGRPETPLNANRAGNDIRDCVTRRKVSFGTRSDAGRTARDACIGAKKTCGKLGVPCRDCPRSRLGVAGAPEVPRLADLVRQRAAA